MLRQEHDEQVRVVLMSGRDVEELRRRTRDRGLDGFFSKPWTNSSLLDALMSALGQERLSRTEANRSSWRWSLP